MRWPRLGAILGLVLLSVLPAAAEGQNAIVRSDPAVIELAPGQTATVSVVLAEARAVYGIDVRATFDTQLVEVVDADPAREGVQFIPGSFPQPDFLVRNEADNQAGALHYAITQVSPSEPVSGNGLVFTVQLRARAGSGEGSFAITAVELSDRDGILLPVQPQSAVIRVAAGSPGAPTAEPTATPTPEPTATPTPIPTATPTPIPTAANPPAVTPPAAATPAAANPPAATAPAAAAPAVASQPASSPASPTPIPAAPAAAAAAPSLEPTRAAAQQPVDPAQDAAHLAAPPATPQAVAAAPAVESAAPDAAPEALAPAAPAVAQPSAMDALPQRPSESREASDQRSPAFDPSNLLLIVGIFAFMAAAVLGVSLVVVLLR